MFTGRSVKSWMSPCPQKGLKTELQEVDAHMCPAGL